jgi:hypothetical protein
MMITVIYTAKAAKLTIDATHIAERLSLQQMERDGQATQKQLLGAGTVTVVNVGAGVFKVLSDAVHITTDLAGADEAKVSIIDNKDDPPPDPPKLTITFDKAAHRAFVIDGRGGSLPA